MIHVVPEELEVAWSLAHEATRVIIDYTVTSCSRVPLQVVDSLFWGNAVAPEVIVVRNDVAPGTVAFTRAYVPTAAKLYVQPPGPTFVELAPGASITRRAFAPWPLRAWHNFDRVEELRGERAYATLEIGYIADPASRLETFVVDGVRHLVATHLLAQRLARGPRISLDR